MKNIKLYFIALLFGALALTPLSSCSEDALGPSIFPDDEETLDPNSTTYAFDLWLEENYRKPYNISFLYKMQDISTNLNYNLVPADYTKAQNLALLIKYLWFDAYNEVAGDEFLKANAPRMIHIIGSPSMNPSSGYETIGMSEGGVKVNLFKVNSMDINNFVAMNKNYFTTMHHEFAHILHQKINYPKEFDEITHGKYDALNWTSQGGNDDSNGYVNSIGFVTKYAMSATREDFAETVAQYITMTDEEWNDMLVRASMGWHPYAITTGTFYSSHFYYNNNQAGDEYKSYILPQLNLEYKSNAAGDTLTLVRYGKDVYQTAVLPISSEDIYDQNGNLVRTSYTDANGAQAKKSSDGSWLVVDGQGNFIPVWVYPTEDEDEVDGNTAIQQKLSIATRWFKNQWNVDLQKLREEVQKRQNEFRADPAGLINRLRKEAKF